MTCTNFAELIALCQSDLESDTARLILADAFWDAGDAEVADWLRRKKKLRDRPYPLGGKEVAWFRGSKRMRPPHLSDLPDVLFDLLSGHDTNAYVANKNVAAALADLFQALRLRAEQL